MLIFIEGLSFIQITDQEKLQDYLVQNLAEKTPPPDHTEVCKSFKAFIFSIRSNIYNFAPSQVGHSLRNLSQVG